MEVDVCRRSPDHGVVTEVKAKVVCQVNRTAKIITGRKRHRSATSRTRRCDGGVDRRTIQLAAIPCCPVFLDVEKWRTLGPRRMRSDRQNECGHQPGLKMRNAW